MLSLSVLAESANAALFETLRTAITQATYAMNILLGRLLVGVLLRLFVLLLVFLHIVLFLAESYVDFLQQHLRIVMCLHMSGCPLVRMDAHSLLEKCL